MASDDELFGAVYAAPDDDSARAVLADVLLQKQSPHGELISLQLAQAAGRGTDQIDKRVAALLNKHALACCAPAVWRALWGPMSKFERGFIASGMLQPRSVKDLRAAIGAAAWATVHTLYAQPFAGVGGRAHELTLELLTHPAMRHLRRVGPLGIEEVAALVEYGVPLPWRDLAIETRDEEKLGTFVGGGRMFPQLERLRISISDPGFEELSGAEWLAKVEVTRANDPTSAW